MYYAVPNDLIGGWDVSLHNKPVGEHDTRNGESTVGSFMSQRDAEMVAFALNGTYYTEGGGVTRKVTFHHPSTLQARTCQGCGIFKYRPSLDGWRALQEHCDQEANMECPDDHDLYAALLAAMRVVLGPDTEVDVP